MTGNGTLTITEFLLARIAEDEAAALTADGPSWSPGDGNVSEGGLYASDWAIAWFEIGETNPGPQLPAFPNWKRHAHENSVHAARHDPARVLAECKAKRAIVDAWQENDELSNHPGLHFRNQVLETTVRILAAVYSDHPDYQQEWA